MRRVQTATPRHPGQELEAGVLGQIKYHALPAAFGLTELHRVTVSGPALGRAVLGVQDNQHRKNGSQQKAPWVASGCQCQVPTGARGPGSTRPGPASDQGRIAGIWPPGLKVVSNDSGAAPLSIAPGLKAIGI